MIRHDPFSHYLPKIRKLHEEVTSAQSNEREIKRIIDQCRTITSNYIKLLNKPSVAGIKLSEYVQSKIKPMIKYVESYLENSTPQEKLKFTNYLNELLTTTWLQIDENYWEEEMKKLISGAVIYGEVDLENLEDLANQTNKDMIEAKITDYVAGLTSDMEGNRWTIHNFDHRKANKKETPPMKEVVHANNAGIMEIFKFFNIATEEQKKQFDDLVKIGNQNDALKLVEKVLGIKFQGDLTK